MKGAAGRNLGLMFLFLVFGAIFGGILGELLHGTTLWGATPYLIKTYPVFDMSPLTINLYILKFTFGLSFHPNLISLLGVLAAYLLFRRF